MEGREVGDGALEIGEVKVGVEFCEGEGEEVEGRICRREVGHFGPSDRFNQHPKDPLLRIYLSTIFVAGQ